MPRVKTELLQEGMVVSSDVKDLDNMLLIPKGCRLTARQIGILQAWGVPQIEVAASAAIDDTDLLAKMPPEQVEKLSQELRATFWKADDADLVFAELFKLLLRRRADRRRPRTGA